MKGICDAIHAPGLEAGIYSDPWTVACAHHLGGSSNDANRTDDDAAVAARWADLKLAGNPRATGGRRKSWAFSRTSSPPPSWPSTAWHSCGCPRALMESE